MLEIGIVGPPGAGKTTLFKALTRAEGGVGQENVGMAPVADERLDKVALVEKARKVTPAAIRVVDVRGAGATLLGNLRQVDALLVVADAYSGTRDPASELESLQLELLVADRDHVERRLSLSDYDDDLPAGLEPLTTKPLLAVENGPGGVDLKLEAELVDLAADEAAAYRDGPSALDDVVRRLFQSLDLITFFTASDKEARAWTLRSGETALAAAATIHSDIARGFIRCEVIRWDDLVAASSRAEVSRRGLQRLEGKTYVVEDGDVLNIRFNV